MIRHAVFSFFSGPSRLAVWLPRVAFGLVLIGFGVNHYLNLDSFIANAQSPFVAVPAIAAVATALAYVVPALMIIGGIFFAVRRLCPLSELCILASLSGIIGWASLGIMLTSDTNVMSGLGVAIQNASVLLILYFVTRKMTRCSPGGFSCCSSRSIH